MRQSLSPYISLYLPISPYISLCLELVHVEPHDGHPREAHLVRVRVRIRVRV